MCQFGDSSKIIGELNISESESLIGYRSNYIINPFNDEEKFLKSLHQDFLWNKLITIKGNPTEENSEGIYSYNYNNNNYNNNNYINYNYINNNYNNYINYNNYNYYILLKIKHWGKVFSYKEGYRSEFALPFELAILNKDSEWFKNSKTVKFANHFNQTVENLAKEYNCNVIELKNYK